MNTYLQSDGQAYTQEIEVNGVNIKLDGEKLMQGIFNRESSGFQHLSANGHIITGPTGSMGAKQIVLGHGISVINEGKNPYLLNDNLEKGMAIFKTALGNNTILAGSTPEQPIVGITKALANAAAAYNGSPNWINQYSIDYVKDVTGANISNYNTPCDPYYAETYQRQDTNGNLRYTDTGEPVMAQKYRPPTATSTPTSTATATSTPTATNTSTATPTATSTSTPTATATPVPTNTSTVTPKPKSKPYLPIILKP